MKYSIFTRVTSFAAALALTSSLLITDASAGKLPVNLGNGLDVLVRANLAVERANRLNSEMSATERAEFDALLDSAGKYRDLAVANDDGRVMVLIYLNGEKSLTSVRKSLIGAGKAEVTSQSNRWRSGVLEAWISVDDAPAIAEMKGVSSVILADKPVTNAGSVTQQGVVQHRVNNVGQDGTGITIGAISNSYNATTRPSYPKANQDVASGDLPGVGNPEGNTQPVEIIEEGAASGTTSSDEGRAMLQLIHDIAPKARLGFATSGGSQLRFADNIRSLAAFPGAPRTVQGFKADIVVDDIIFLAEPIFSDGIVSQGVNDVTAAGTHYFSSAGNRPASQGYASDFRFVSAQDLAAATAGTNLNFSGVPAEIYAGGFHNFRTDGGQDIAQDIRRELGQGTTSAAMNFQWDDPFDKPAFPGTLIFTEDKVFPADNSGQAVQDTIVQLTAGNAYRITVLGTDANNFDSIVSLIDPDGVVVVNNQDTGAGETLGHTATKTGNFTVRVRSYCEDGECSFGAYRVQVFANPASFLTTDYNMLFFRKDNGAYLGAASSNNVGTNQPIELFLIPFPNEAVDFTTVQMVIARRVTPNPQANRMRYVLFDQSGSALPSEYTSTTTPITYGHNTAANGFGVAAYSPFHPYIPEDFTSPGPHLNVFDANGDRLATPQIRLKPDLAAMDGANNTFFSGSDTNRDLDTFPNFFGTSAAAPNAAAIAGLVLQKAGGPGSLSVAQMKQILTSTTFLHDLNPTVARGTASTGTGKLTIQVTGDNSLSSLQNTRGYTVSYVGSGSVESLSINLQNASPKSGNAGEPGDRPQGGFTPGLVFDNAAFSGGQAFAVGIANGIAPSNIVAAYTLPAPAPATAARHFYQLDLTFTPGTFTGGKGFTFAADRDEFRSAFGPPTGQTRDGGNADLLSDGVILPEGTIRAGRATFSGTLVGGTPFSGQFTNAIGRGWTFLDGYGFINAEAAINATPSGATTSKQ